jgi:Domain of unknown function (DUF4258)
LSKIGQIQVLVKNGLYYLSEHANDEMQADGFDIYDVENSIVSGKTRRSWPREGKYEVIGPAIDGRSIGIICRITQGHKVRVITVYEDHPIK